MTLPIGENDLLAALGAIVGEAGVRSGDSIPQRNFQDAAGLAPVSPLAVVMPTTTEQVAAILRLCRAVPVPVVVQGGMTGLAGGAHPQAGEVALSMERLRGIEEIDLESRTMTVRAGTILAEVQQAAADAGLFYGVDLGARGSCTIGGNVATNAGGIQVMRYGMTRRNVLGIEAVLPDGRIVRSLNKMAKNNTGYDWKELLIGSEGTLGVVTRVVLALQPAPESIQSAFCAVAGVKKAHAVLSRLEARFPGRIVAFEAMWREYMQVATRLLADTRPFAAEPEIALIAEAAIGDGEDARTAFVEALGSLMEEGTVLDGRVAQSEADRKRFWTWREANYEFDRILPPASHFDVSIAPGRMEEAISLLRARVASTLPGGLLVAYGHMADSNLHLAVYAADAVTPATACDAVIYATVGELGGSISAEHGIGVLKRPYLALSRSAEEIELMRGLKELFDPASILGRGRIL